MGNLVLAGATSGSTTLTPTDAVTATITLPSTSGTLALTSGSQTFTNLTVTNDASIHGLTVGQGYTSGSDNTAVGIGALQATTGYQNSAFGKNALIQNGAGYVNTALGFSTLYSNTTGNNNTAVGNSALFSNTTASNNTAVGYQALLSNTTNNDNTAIGNGALYQTNAIENTAIGRNAGASTTSGASNVYVGMQAGNWNVNHTTGSNCVFVGERTSPAAGSDSYEIVIGAGCVGKGGSTGFIYAGGGGVYQGNNSSSWSTTSDARIKENVSTITTGLETIAKLRPVTFDYILTKKSDAGFIAQEFQTVLPDQVQTHAASPDEKTLTGSDTLYGINPNLVPYLVSAIQELNTLVTTQAAEIAALKAKVGA